MWEDGDAFAISLRMGLARRTKKPSKTPESDQKDVLEPTSTPRVRLNLSKMKKLLRQRAVLKGKLRKIRIMLEKYQDKVKKTKEKAQKTKKTKIKKVLKSW